MHLNSKTLQRKQNKQNQILIRHTNQITKICSVLKFSQTMLLQVSVFSSKVNVWKTCLTTTESKKQNKLIQSNILAVLLSDPIDTINL